VDFSDDICLGIYLQQQRDKGISPTTSGIDGSVLISGESSLTGDLPASLTESVWKFSETAASFNYYQNQQMYRSGFI
jgi:hypothetical protein